MTAARGFSSFFAVIDKSKRVVTRRHRLPIRVTVALSREMPSGLPPIQGTDPEGEVEIKD
jgi:hypothetical protein